jgi:hypothetical protein
VEERERRGAEGRNKYRKRNRGEGGEGKERGGGTKEAEKRPKR